MIKLGKYLVQVDFTEEDPNKTYSVIGGHSIIVFAKDEKEAERMTKAWIESRPKLEYVTLGTWKINLLQEFLITEEFTNALPGVIVEELISDREL